MVCMFGLPGLSMAGVRDREASEMRRPTPPPPEAVFENERGRIRCKQDATRTNAAVNSEHDHSTTLTIYLRTLLSAGGVYSFSSSDSARGFPSAASLGCNAQGINSLSLTGLGFLCFKFGFFIVTSGIIRELKRDPVKFPETKGREKTATFKLMRNRQGRGK